MNHIDFTTIGQDKAVKSLTNILKSGRIPNSFLFFGPTGSGKLYTALTFSKKILCKTKVASGRKCNTCSKINNGTHSDITIIDKESKSITIETIREIQKRVSLKPYESDKQVIIINSAEEITMQAGNAFLKILEEPPGYVIFILITSNSNSILQTILSRCQLVQFKPLSIEDGCNILVNSFGFIQDDALDALHFANRKIGEALNIDLEFANKMKKLALRTIDSFDYNLFDEVQEVIKQNKAAAFLEILITEIRDIIFTDRLNDNYKNLTPDSNIINIERYLMIYDIVINTWGYLLKNIKQELALEYMLLKIKDEVVPNG